MIEFPATIANDPFDKSDTGIFVDDVRSSSFYQASYPRRFSQEELNIEWFQNYTVSYEKKYRSDLISGSVDANKLAITGYIENMAVFVPTVLESDTLKKLNKFCHRNYIVI
jgi:hypothetical protein